MNYSTSERLFTGQSVADYLEEKRRAIANLINSKEPNELLNTSVEQLTEYLVSVNELAFPSLDDENYTISSHEGEIPASRFPPEFAILDRSKRIKQDIIVFHVPYTGNIACLHLRPSTFNLSGVPPVMVSPNEFLFEYINFYNDANSIKTHFLNDLRAFKQNVDSLKDDFAAYNSCLRRFISGQINGRREQLLAKGNFLASFNVPLKANENVPKTFSVPSPVTREKIIIPKPVASHSQFVPEPALDYTNYQKILKIIDDVGRNFERMPSLYQGKGEEDLRDHILMVLDPNFQYGSATGETFNKKGKTDILLRYDSSVVFVAECKFWGGQEMFHKTIDQLLSYLTWRDSKTAVILFVRNKEISAVLQKAKEATGTHPCYITSKEQKAENWSEHVFHLPDDPNREVIVTALVFHLPEK